MGNDMTEKEKAEVIDTFISIGEKFLKENKHFHLEPILARDTIQAIKELEKELEQWKQEWQDAQIKANEEGFARTTLQIKYNELEKENAELERKLCDSNELCNQQALRIAELEEKISFIE